MTIREYRSIAGKLILSEEYYDEAIIGVSQDERVIYDYDKLAEILQKKGMTEEEAFEYIDYNIIRAIPYFGDYAPIIMCRMTPDELL